MSEAFTFTYCLFFQEFSNYLKSIFLKAPEKKYSNLENFMIPLFLELHKMLQISSRHVQMYNTGHTFSFIVKTSLFSVQIYFQSISLMSRILHFLFQHIFGDFVQNRNRKKHFILYYSSKEMPLSYIELMLRQGKFKALICYLNARHNSQTRN